MPISATTTRTCASSACAAAIERGRAGAALALLALTAACASTSKPGEAPAISPAADPQAAGMVDIRSLVPDIDLDIRYAGHRNFVGAPVDGYEAPRCYLLRPAAQALQRVEAALRREGLRLRLFDCYRPARAVRHFVRWAGDPLDRRTQAEYYPNLDKSQLLGAYISPTSGHSRGATVDLTLLRCAADGSGCAELDMGTGFDFFDPRANTDSPAIAAGQRAHRQRLRAAMEREGFANYPMEWWHYTLRPEPSPGTAYDFPLR